MLYTVIDGDTLSSIAEKFGIPTSSLISLNNISDPDHIFIGQVLLVTNIPDAPAATMFSKPTILIRNTIAIIFLLAGAYLSISAIIALPLLEEEANYKNEDFYALNEQIDKQRDQTIIYLNEINIDSITRMKYDSLSSLLGKYNKSEMIVNRFNIDKQNVIEYIKDQANHCKLLYINTGVMGKIKKDDFASGLLLNYSNLCMDNKQLLFEVRNKLIDSTSYLFSGFSPKKIADPPNKIKPGAGYFIPVGWVLREKSQNLAIIFGLMGFALFGAVIGASGKKSFNDVNTDQKRTDGAIYFEIVVVLIRGFSAALVVYLSLKGGLSLITTTSSDKINPYVILFLCFISAVFSDNIWEWAKAKLVNSDPSGSADQPKGGGSDPKSSVEKKSNS